MTRSMPFAFAAALLSLAACSTAPRPMAVAVPVAPPPLSDTDQAFINAAAASDAGEMQSSQLAEAKARNPRIKAFAAKMVADHTESTQKLTTIAQAKGVTVNAAPTEMAQKMETKLEAAKPGMFDREYVTGQVASHRAAASALQSEIDNGQDADLKAFAAATLPIVKQHLAMAERLSGRG